MPLLDVSDILTDPDFAEPDGALQLIRRTRTTGSDGRTVLSTQTLPLSGNVQPAPGSKLQLLPEGARVEGAIEITTQTLLYAQTNATAADIVVWQGRQYQAELVEPWGSYGAGFCSAVCTLMSMTEAPRP